MVTVIVNDACSPGPSVTSSAGPADLTVSIGRVLPFPPVCHSNSLNPWMVHTVLRWLMTTMALLKVSTFGASPGSITPARLASAQGGGWLDPAERSLVAVGSADETSAVGALSALITRSELVSYARSPSIQGAQ